MSGPAAAAGPSAFETAAVRGLLRVTVIVGRAFQRNAIVLWLFPARLRPEILNQPQQHAGTGIGVR